MLTTRLTCPPEEAGLAKQLGQGIDKIEKDGIGLIKASLRSHDIAAAKRQIVETVEPMFEMIRAPLTSIVDLQISGAREEYDHAVDRYTTLRWASIASIVAGVGMAGVLALSSFATSPRHCRRPLTRPNASPMAT